MAENNVFVFFLILPKIKPKWNFLKKRKERKENNWKMKCSFPFKIDLQNRSQGVFSLL